MIKFNSEKEFQTWFIKWLEGKWFYVRNIPDIWNTKKPFDLFWCFDWMGHAFELKIDKSESMSTPERIIKKLYPHQIANLIKFKSWKSKWRSYVICYHQKTNTMIDYDIDLNWNLIEKKKVKIELSK